MQFYKQQGPAYYLYSVIEGNEMLHKVHDDKGVESPQVFTQIAIAYVAETGRLITHGEATDLAIWCDTHNANVPDNAKAKVFSFAPGAPVEAINKALKDPTFLATLIV